MVEPPERTTFESSIFRRSMSHLLMLSHTRPATPTDSKPTMDGVNRASGHFH